MKNLKKLNSCIPKGTTVGTTERNAFGENVKLNFLSSLNIFSSLAELGIYYPCGSRGSISWEEMYYLWGKKDCW